MPSLRELYRKNPHCTKCGRLTTLNQEKGGKQKARHATVEHVYPKGHYMREGNKKTVLLYCFECNQVANELWIRARLLYSEFKGVLSLQAVRSLRRVNNPYSEETQRIREENRQRLK